MENLIHGLTGVTSGAGPLYLLAGSVLGVIIGMIPGMPVVIVLSIILVFAPRLNITDALALFLGAQSGGFYAASVAAILLNTPPHPEALPITFDGYPMARAGKPGQALGLSACSTCIGGLIGCGVFIGLLQVINSLNDLVHPPEYAALVILAMLLVGGLGTDSIGKAVVAAGAGILTSCIGPSNVTGFPRYTFNSVALDGGLSLIALALGVFVIPQMIMVFGTGTATAWQDMTGQAVSDATSVGIEVSGYGKSVIRGVFETFRHWKILLQSGLIGGVTGAIPGIGGFAGNYMAYGIAKMTSRNGRLFGTGEPDGIIAPEGSSLAKEAGHLIPLIGLGIPGGIAGALFIGLLEIKNIHPGYGFQQANPNLTGEMTWIIALSGIIGTLIGVLLGPRIAHVTRVPGPLIAPFVLAICVAGVFVEDQLFTSVVEIFIFTLIGLGLRRLRYPLGGLVLGFVLGPTLETNVSETHQIYHGLSFITARPIADVIGALAIAFVIVRWIQNRREKKAGSASLAQSSADEDDPSIAVERPRASVAYSYPLLTVLMEVFLLGISVFAIVYALNHYNLATSMLPLIAGFSMAVPTALVLPRDIYRYRSLRHLHTIQQNSASEAQDDVLDLSQVVSDERVSVLKHSWARHGQYRRELGAIGWLLVLIGLCWLVGFVIGSGFFMLVYATVSTRKYFKTLWAFGIFAVISTGAIAGAIYEMLSVTAIVFTPRINF